MENYVIITQTKKQGNRISIPLNEADTIDYVEKLIKYSVVDRITIVKERKVTK